jgi:hypothetical protein
MYDIGKAFDDIQLMLQTFIFKEKIMIYCFHAIEYPLRKLNITSKKLFHSI